MAKQRIGWTDLLGHHDTVWERWEHLDPGYYADLYTIRLRSLLVRLDLRQRTTDAALRALGYRRRSGWLTMVHPDNPGEPR